MRCDENLMVCRGGGERTLAAVLVRGLFEDNIGDIVYSRRDQGQTLNSGSYVKPRVIC